VRDGNEDKLRQAAAATTEEESADVMFGMHEDDIILAVRSNNTVDYVSLTGPACVIAVTSCVLKIPSRIR
jgi:hypothetical protein